MTKELACLNTLKQARVIKVLIMIANKRPLDWSLSIEDARLCEILIDTALSLLNNTHLNDRFLLLSSNISFEYHLLKIVKESAGRVFLCTSHCQDNI